MKNLITLPIKSKFYQDMGLDMFWVRFPWLPEADTKSFFHCLFLACLSRKPYLCDVLVI
jgi:hypothetical protein